MDPSSAHTRNESNEFEAPNALLIEYIFFLSNKHFSFLSSVETTVIREDQLTPKIVNCLMRFWSSE